MEYSDYTILNYLKTAGRCIMHQDTSRGVLMNRTSLLLYCIIVTFTRNLVIIVLCRAHIISEKKSEATIPETLL